MSNDNPNLATLPSTILQGINTRLKDVHTAMPGIVVSFNTSEQTVSVQPAVKRVFRTIDADKEILTPADLPILINVPIIFPRGGGFSLTFPISAGDECLLVFAERAIDRWHKFGGVREPNNKRFHSLSDATAFVGLSSIPNKIPAYSSTDTVLRNDEGDQTIALASNKDIKIDTPANADITAGGSVTVKAPNVTLDATTVLIDAANTNVTGNLTVDGLVTANNGISGSGGASISGNIAVSGGDVSADGIALKTHVHSQSDDSGGNIEQDTDVAS